MRAGRLTEPESGVTTSFTQTSAPQWPKKCTRPSFWDAVTDPINDRATAERWFSNTTGSGSAAVQRMTRFFSVLIEADPVSKPERKPASGRSAPVASGTKSRRDPGVAKTEEPRAKPQEEGEEAPSVHINLQIHVSSDATPDQIDKIFESIATHVYRKA